MACTICNEECGISDHRKKLKMKCRVCATTLEDKNKTKTSIGNIKDKTGLKKYKSFITQILNFKKLLSEDKDRYPEQLCRPCVRNVISKMLDILPQIVTLQTKGKDKEEFERIVSRIWDIEIIDFPIHSDLRGESECGEPSPDRRESECEEPSPDERTDATEDISDIQSNNEMSLELDTQSDDDEQGQSHETTKVHHQQQRRTSASTTHESNRASDENEEEDLVHETPKSKRKEVRTPASTTPTTHKRLTEVPLESPQDLDKKKKDGLH